MYDEFFPARLELFYRLVRDYVNSFVVNLKQRRDRGFHVFRELCQFLFKLGRRCIRSPNLPSESDYRKILNLSIPDVKALSTADFLTRSKLDVRIAPACKSKAESEKGKKKNEGLTLDTIIANCKEEFGRNARSYVIFLFKGTQGLSRFTSDIVRGLGSFDLDVMLVDPLENAIYCFKQLFTSFRLRGVFQADEESIFTEEYLSFLDIVRSSHPDIQQPKLLIADAIHFVSSQESLVSRPHLRRIFRLSCLCLDEPRMSFTPVKFGSHRTDDPLSTMFDVIAPIQSFLGYVGHGLDVLTSDASVSRFLPLEQSFWNSGLSDLYSPWDSVDHFGMTQIRENLESKEARNQSGPQGNSAAEETPMQSFPVPKPGKRHSHLLSGEELTESASRLVAGSSKR